MQDFGLNLLSNLVFLRTYASTKPDGKKESYLETVDRVEGMHVAKFPYIESEIKKAFSWVRTKHVVPSMRSMQFAGQAIAKSPIKLYNCSFTAITKFKDIADIAFLSMNGVGCGYSVQNRHVSQLPVIYSGELEVFQVPDNREGWSDSFELLLENPALQFDYSVIRPKGAPLSSGGTASGPGALLEAHSKIRKILESAVERKLSTIETHDIICHVADAVVCGGVRRSALISIFDCDDTLMLSSKKGEWWVENPQRGRANNSAVLHRASPTFEADYRRIMQACYDSFAGEPGIFLTNDYEYGVNPCCEISLKDGQLCNLTEINVAQCRDAYEFLQATWAATFIGTLQAAYTDFSYVQEKFRINCEAEALLGVSLTGQAERWDLLEDAQLLEQASLLMRQVNAALAPRIGIKAAARIGCVKPSGSTSALLGTSSGIHAAHAAFYLRRIRMDISDPLAVRLMQEFGVQLAGSGNIVELDAFNPENIVVTIPVSKQSAIVREKESSVELLNRTKHIYQHWIKTSHNYGPNTHNVSLTVSYKDEEWSDIVEWMYENRDYYSGVSLLPYSGGSYQQMPFSDITEEEYLEWKSRFKKEIDFSTLDYSHQLDERIGEVACGGGACEIR